MPAPVLTSSLEPPTGLYGIAVSKGLVDPLESTPMTQGEFPWDCWVRFLQTPKSHLPLFSVDLAGIPVPVRKVEEQQVAPWDGDTWEVQTTRLVRRGQTMLANCPHGSRVWVERLRSFIIHPPGVPLV